MDTQPNMPESPQPAAPRGTVRSRPSATTLSGVKKPSKRVSPKVKAQAAAVSARFLEAYPSDPVPALNFTSPYEAVCAVSLSAQTTDDNVNKVLPTLFARYPSPRELAEASQLEVEEIVHSLGFFRNKAKNLIGMARLVVAEYGGEIPGTMEDLVRLPGVARKTANIVLAESFGIVSGIAVDTHVFRVSHKLGLSKAKTPELTEWDLCAVFPHERWHRVNFEMITFGRTVCDAKKPKCAECFLQDLCPSAFK